MKALTAPQRRMLAEVAASPNGKSYNGRARRSVEALKAQGLVTSEFELVPHVRPYGPGCDYTERYTLRLAEPIARAAEALARNGYTGELDARRVGTLERGWWRVSRGNAYVLADDARGLTDIDWEVAV